MKKITLLLALLLVTLTGCQSAPKTKPAAPAGTSTPAETYDLKAAYTGEKTEDGEIILYYAVGGWTDADGSNHVILSDGEREAITRFNEADNGYHLETVVYDQNVGGTVDTPEFEQKNEDFQLQQDILQGNLVDIVSDGSFARMARYEILSEKGAFADLYGFLDGETGLSRSDLMEHVLSVFETKDGKLCQMPARFMIDTMIGRESLVGTKENWTLDDLISHWDAVDPEEIWFCSENTTYYVYINLLRNMLPEFVDYDTLTCSFDSPEFISLLEFCGQFPETIEKSDVRNENQFLEQGTWFGNFMSYHDILTDNAEQDPYVIVGYPSTDGCGSFFDADYERYSICATSDPVKQEGAWEFLSVLLGEDMQYRAFSDNEEMPVSESIRPDSGFPINKAAFEAEAAQCYDREGETVVETGTASGNFFSKTITFPSRAEYEQLLNYINSITKKGGFLDRELVFTIIEEEVGMYFAGDHTAQQAAEAIQGRVEIMLAEKA